MHSSAGALDCEEQRSSHVKGEKQIVWLIGRGAYGALTCLRLIAFLVLCRRNGGRHKSDLNASGIEVARAGYYSGDAA